MCIYMEKRTKYGKLKKKVTPTSPCNNSNNVRIVFKTNINLIKRINYIAPRTPRKYLLF